MIILYRSFWYGQRISSRRAAETARDVRSIAETVSPSLSFSLRRRARRASRNYGLEENKKGNRVEKQNCRVEWRVEVESKAATLYSLEIVPRYWKTERDSEHKRRTIDYKPIICSHIQVCPNNIFAIQIYIFYVKFEFVNLKNLLCRNV